MNTWKLAVWRRAWRKLFRHPLIAAKNVLSKLLIDRARYATQNGYDAERYWGDRLSNGAFSFRSVGDQGLSEAENLAQYVNAGERLLAVIRNLGVDIAVSTVLDVGVGNGFFARLLTQAGAKHYHGIDITDSLFAQLRCELPQATFAKHDITGERIEGEYDVVTMIDVIEHIVTRSGLQTAMQNLLNVTIPGGLVVISGMQEHTGRLLFYTHAWSVADVKKALNREPLWVEPFRGTFIAFFRA
jgi:2-polyprenyl-3-methyl-5-hydroxy-6-metoxy-1,4-benzoquinol methylase